MTLNYNPSLAEVKVNPHTKNQGHSSNGHERADRQTHRRKDGSNSITSIADAGGNDSSLTYTGACYPSWLAPSVLLHSVHPCSGRNSSVVVVVSVVVSGADNVVVGTGIHFGHLP